MPIRLAFFVLIATYVRTSASIKIQDVLNGDLLPSSLILEGMETSAELNHVVNQTKSIIRADIDNALNTMGFHRQKMNEYLCRSYVAEQILDEMAPQRRSGEPAPNALPSRKTKDKKRNSDNVIKENMLEDSGSESYKNWLSRSATLEDIYRHYDDSRRIGTEDVPVPIGIPEVRIPAGLSYGSELAHLQHPFGSFPQRGYHFGKVDPGVSGYGGGAETGYGSTGAYPETTPGAYGSASGAGPWQQGASPGPWQGGGGGGPWQGGGGGGGGWMYHHHEESDVSDEKSEKGMKLKDLFDLALTALAFLAFGAFKVQLIMCLTNNGTVTSTVSPSVMSLIVRHRRSEDLIPDSLDLNGEEDEMYVEDEVSSGDTSGMNPLYEWDHLSMLAVRAMDAATLLDGRIHSSDKAQDCLRRQICEGNRFSRQMSGVQRIWMPVWNFAMSWVSGRAYSDGDSERLENLKASLLGLANARCESLYATCSNQDLARMREERKAKRRRRRRGDPGDLTKSRQTR